MSEDGVLFRLEALVDTAGVAERLARIETALPVGVRPRQLRVRTLLLGMLVALSDGRPAHLVRVHQALVGLADIDRRRLGVVVTWKTGPHTLTYRQVERTFSLVVGVLAKAEPDGSPTEALQGVCDALIEASVPGEGKPQSSSLAVDWTDVESFSTRRTKPEGTYADEEAAWGHRKGGGPGEKDELFFGYYLSLATMVHDDAGPEVPELVRRMQLSSCDHDPVPVMTDVLVSMAASGDLLGDVVADSGYAHRVPSHFALPLRRAGATLVMDLHPTDRGPQGTHRGAICWNGNLYCPKTPPALFDLGPLARGSSAEEVAAHDHKTAELARFKLGRVGGPDPDGYSRVTCPAQMGKLRCPLRPTSIALDLTRPENPGASRAPPSVLHAADDHRPTRRQRQDRSAPRLPLSRLAPLLCETLRRRAVQRPDQGPRHDRRRPGVVPADGACADEPVLGRCPRRAQPGRGGRVRGSPGRTCATGGRRPGTEDPTPATQDAR